MLYQKGLNYAYPNITTVYCIYLTLPVTSASVERSFSKLKLVKNALRSTMCENRLTSLLILSIEKDLVDSTDLNNIIFVLLNHVDYCYNKKSLQVTCIATSLFISWLRHGWYYMHTLLSLLVVPPARLNILVIGETQVILPTIISAHMQYCIGVYFNWCLSFNSDIPLYLLTSFFLATNRLL